MNIKQEAEGYLRQFKRPVGAALEDGYYERRAEAMRRGRMAGLTYVAIADAVGLCRERAAKVIEKHVKNGQCVEISRWPNPKRALRMTVTPLTQQDVVSTLRQGAEP